MSEERKDTDDVSGVALPPESSEDLDAPAEELGAEPTATADPPAAVAELAAACVRFVATRYGIHLDFDPDTLSLVDQWEKDARLELKDNPSLVDIVQGAAGAYLGEVIRRAFGATWSTEGEHSEWRLMMASVYCAFNPLGMAREALFLGEADGWHAHFELDPGERDMIEARLAALPEVDEDDYYAPSTRFDMVHTIVDALREMARATGRADVRFDASDYEGV